MHVCSKWINNLQANRDISFDHQIWKLGNLEIVLWLQDLLLIHKLPQLAQECNMSAFTAPVLRQSHKEALLLSPAHSPWQGIFLGQFPWGFRSSTCSFLLRKQALKSRCLQYSMMACKTSAVCQHLKTNQQPCAMAFKRICKGQELVLSGNSPTVKTSL